jgi:hypothetical protein
VREPDLFSLPVPSRGPFGEEPPRWYRGQKRERAPGRYARPLAVICSLVALAGTQLHGPAAALILIFVLGVPAASLDAWWRKREQRRREAVLPEVKATD